MKTTLFILLVTFTSATLLTGCGSVFHGLKTPEQRAQDTRDRIAKRRALMKGMNEEMQAIKDKYKPKDTCAELATDDNQATCRDSK